jgi:capsular exopolysaccharide synthesis family protein
LPQYDLNLNDYIRILRKRRFIIALTTIAAIFSSWYYSSLQVPYYKAQTTIKIEQRQNLAGLLTEWVEVNPADVMESSAKDLKGFPVMKKVALRLGLITADSPQDKINSVVSGLQGSVEAETVKSTNIIQITTSGDEPKGAMDLANMVAQVYVEENLLGKKKQALTTRQFIEEQLASLETRLREAEEDLSKFENQTKSIKMNSPIQQKLVDLQVERIALLQRFTGKHPQVQQIEDQIKELEARLKGFSQKELEYARLSREVEVNQKLYSMLKEKLEEARITEAQKVGDVSIVDPAVSPITVMSTDRRTGMTLGALIGLVLGLILAFIMENMDTSIGNIEEVENFTKLPVVGVVPSMKSELDEKKPLFKRSLLSLFSADKKHLSEYYMRLIVHYEPNSVLAEAYRSIRTNLKLSPSVKTFLVTSSGPREGKTTVITNLGLAIAQTGAKTLLVSSDLRRPTVAKSFGLCEEPGLNEVLTKVKSLDEVLCGISDIMMGNMQMDEVMKTPGIENLSILPSGRIPARPAELLNSRDMQSLITELTKRFDFVLFDAPPVLPIADAMLLAPKVDGVILVYEAGKTVRSALLRTKSQLEGAGGKIIGIVLNHIKPGSEMASNYPYYYKYKYGDVKAGKKSDNNAKNKN